MDARAIDIDGLERRILRVETWLILLSITAIATADYFVGRDMSLGPLFLIPLSYSALTNRPSTTVLLLLLCVLLRQAFGPIQVEEDPWNAFFRDLAIAGVFIATVGYLGRLGRERRLFFELARRQRDELSQELDVAAEVQRRLLALCEMPGDELDVAARTEQLRSVGGDYYDFVKMGSGRTGIAIADVAGKGLQAALFMPAVRIALRSIVTRVDDPSAILEELNSILFNTTEVRHYATLFFACVSPDSGVITYVNAGHLPPLLVDADGRTSWLEKGGTPVGLVPDATYASGSASLGPGAVLVLYTDGVTEAFDGEGRQFGTERLERVVKAHRGRPAKDVVAAVLEEVERFAAGRERSDDTTIIVVRRSSEG